MNCLLDTHVLLWWLDESPRLGVQTHKILEDPRTNIFVSAVSIWEISIKLSIGRLKFAAPPDETILKLLARGCRQLTVNYTHAFAVRHLPLHHADPFDRMLVAQAQCEDLTLVTADHAIALYDIRTLDATD